MNERFSCSPEANAMWARLINLYRLRRAGVAADRPASNKYKSPQWGPGDCQAQGRNWAEWGACPPSGNHSDLATDARLLFIASVGALTRLEEQGLAQQAAVTLARRRLGAQRVSDVRRRFGLNWEDGWELVDMVKEWLAWALDDPLEDEPELPWPDTIRSGLTTVVY